MTDQYYICTKRFHVCIAFKAIKRICLATKEKTKATVSLKTLLYFDRLFSTSFFDLFENFVIFYRLFDCTRGSFVLTRSCAMF
jgi:hypothetical protein